MASRSTQTPVGGGWTRYDYGDDQPIWQRECPDCDKGLLYAPVRECPRCDGSGYLISERNPTMRDVGPLSTPRRYTLFAYCETCGREFYTASSAKKFCDVPTCRGYLRHIDRGRNHV